VQVRTPLGEYPFEFRRAEFRDRRLVVVGLVAGLESSVVLGPGDLKLAARHLALPLGAATLAGLAWHRARS
jgi:hypothetical protein